MWLATHALEIGAVSVMMYCFREREQLLNVNEMLAGFRMFPSYLRIGGLREDLPSGFHQTVKKWLDAFPGHLNEYEDLLTKNQIWLKRTQNVGVITKDDAMTYGLAGPMARATGVAYDVRRAFPYLGYETYDFDVPTQTTGDVYGAVPGARRRDAGEHARSRSRRSRASRRAASSTSRTTRSCRRPRTRSIARWKR